MQLRDWKCLRRRYLWPQKPFRCRLMPPGATYPQQTILQGRGKWCRGTESNCRHQPFQGCALPTELPRHTMSFQQVADRNLALMHDSQLNTQLTWSKPARVVPAEAPSVCAASTHLMAADMQVQAVHLGCLLAQEFHDRMLLGASCCDAHCRHA